MNVYPMKIYSGVRSGERERELTQFSLRVELSGRYGGCIMLKAVRNSLKCHVGIMLTMFVLYSCISYRVQLLGP